MASSSTHCVLLLTVTAGLELISLAPLCQCQTGRICLKGASSFVPQGLEVVMKLLAELAILQLELTSRKLADFAQHSWSASV